MNILAKAQDIFSKFAAADTIWIIGAVILFLLAIKVIAKVFKVLLIIGAVLLLIGFVFSGAIFPR